MRVLSLQRLGAGVHDRHHNRVDAALPQTGAHSKTLPRYPHFTLNSCVLLFLLLFHLILAPLNILLQDVMYIPSAFCLSLCVSDILHHFCWICGPKP